MRSQLYFRRRTAGSYSPQHSAAIIETPDERECVWQEMNRGWAHTQLDSHNIS